MNNLISYLVIVSLLLPAFAFGDTKEDAPSIGDLIGEILAGDNAYKSYLHVYENEKPACTDCSKQQTAPLSKDEFYEGWKLNCVALHGSELCDGLKPEDEISCDEPPKTPWYSNVWEKTKSCGSGIKKSWEDFFKFMQQIGNYIINKEVEVKNADGTVTKTGTRTKFNQDVSKAWNSMTAYMSMEMTKHQDKYNVSKSKAFLAVTGKMMKQFTAGLNAMLAKVAPKVGCYNYKAKTRVICQVLAEFFAEPILMFKFIKMGPKILKGTRIAKFFDFHKGKVIAKVVGKADSLKLQKIDFIAKDAKVLTNIYSNPKLNNAIATNKKIFEEIFPDKKSLDDLDTYLSSISKEESDELADVIRILGEDKAKMSPQQYQDIIGDLKQSIKASCGL